VIKSGETEVKEAVVQIVKYLEVHGLLARKDKAE